MEIDLDSATRAIHWNKNGGAYSSSLDITSLGLPLYVAVEVETSGEQMTVNFGATSYADTPTSGYGAW
jgi:hypothetical protein